MKTSRNQGIQQGDRAVAETRRDFLKRGIAAGSVLAVPAILAGPLSGAASPSNRTNVGLLGCGNIGHWHISFLKAMPDVRIVAVTDPYRSRRESTAAMLNEHYGEKGTVTAHADFRDILARSDVDAVIVGAHDNWHMPMSIAAAKADKDVFCQKPLGLDFGLTKLLRTVVRDRQRIFQFGTQYRSVPRYRQMIQLVRNGYIGLANIAARTGKAIQWDAENETIVGDTDASQMLTLPYREQWKVW